MGWPRRAADGSVIDLVAQVAPEEMERVQVVLAALRLLGAAGLCGESYHAGSGGRVVRVMISCDRSDCPICTPEAGVRVPPASEARTDAHPAPEPGETSDE